MYLHLGEQTVVNDRYIIGIFDIENTSVSKDTRDFLRAGDGAYTVVNVSISPRFRPRPSESGLLHGITERQMLLL